MLSACERRDQNRTVAAFLRSTNKPSSHTVFKLPSKHAVKELHYRLKAKGYIERLRQRDSIEQLSLHYSN